jgi:hypothetical protein
LRRISTSGLIRELNEMRPDAEEREKIGSATGSAGRLFGKGLIGGVLCLAAQVP